MQVAKSCLKGVAVFAVAVAAWAGCTYGGARGGIAVGKDVATAGTVHGWEIGGGIAGGLIGSSVGGTIGTLAAGAAGLGLFARREGGEWKIAGL